MDKKNQIIDRFRRNVKGKIPDTNNQNQRHDGREGHWLQYQLGIPADANNAPDLFGFELKNATTSKTSFGDWSANEYIYKSGLYPNIFNSKKVIDNRNIFLRIFGKPNQEKGGRFSWSGEPCPKISRYNRFGQRLVITDEKDIIAEYSYSKDMRSDKSTIVPKELQQENLILAKWFGEVKPDGKRGKTLKQKLEDKFNDKGWFTCKKDNDGAYCKICFGKPMIFDNWLDLIREGVVFFDSGMYETNGRPYSQWRANNNYWDSLIDEDFE